ncbi:MAG: acetyl-CoA hydrolase/transferase C-terminal domain-containing protein [Dehalococcoidia bacterium]
MDWTEEYKRKLVSAEEAVKLVKSGDRVHTGIYPIPRVLPYALAARRDELQNVQIVMVEPTYDPGWLQPGWEDAFPVTVEIHLGSVAVNAMDERRIDYSPVLFNTWFKPLQERRADAKPIDVNMCVVSPPDRNGFCSFGAHLWNKKTFASLSNMVLAEVDETFVRTYGTNYIHVSEIDRFVEHTPPMMSDAEAEGLINGLEDQQRREELRGIASRIEVERRREFLPQLAELSLSQMRQWAAFYAGLSDPGPDVKRMAEYVSELVPDGATIQVGMGTPSTLLPTLGTFDDKQDLGIHSEMAAPGLIKLVEKGIATGKHITTHPGKAVLSALTASTIQEVGWAADNPLVELHESHEVVSIQSIAAIDNMVTINNALSVDFSGQINSETIFGGRLVAGTGGQTELHMGAGPSSCCVRPPWAAPSLG